MLLLGTQLPATKRHGHVVLARAQTHLLACTHARSCTHEQMKPAHMQMPFYERTAPHVDAPGVAPGAHSTRLPQLTRTARMLP